MENEYLFCEVRPIPLHVISWNQLFISHYTILCQLAMQPHLNYW